MIAIYKRELGSYFQSMIGYAFIAFLMLFVGIYFTVYNVKSGYPYFSYALASCMFVFVIAIPLLTMKCFAEERKNKTDQMLLTAPVSVTSIVMGKYLAMVTVFLIPCLVCCVYPLVIKSFGTAYLKVDYASIFIFFVIGCVYIAIGMFLSSLTESQIIAVVSTIATLLVLYFWEGLISLLPTGEFENCIGIVVLCLIMAAIFAKTTENWMMGLCLGVVGIGGTIVAYLLNKNLFASLLGELLGVLNFTSIFTTVIDSNLLDLSSVVLCVSLVFLMVFITIQSIQKRRWS